jgi:hypothetical protein
VIIGISSAPAFTHTRALYYGNSSPGCYSLSYSLGVSGSGPSGRRRRARGARLALHGPAWREGARAWTHQKSQTLTYENREFSAQMNPTPVYRGRPSAGGPSGS